uniref:protein-tyrosine-phosphatase n=1 Tax=Romanomermis culicivorax TaxID=13658 RepID=A0A915KJX5_ROMCU
MLKVYDAYGDEADMVHYGSTVEFLCNCAMLWCQTSADSMDLMLNGNRINSTKDRKRSQVTKFTVRVDEHFKLGQYKCVMGDEQWTAKSLEYHLCADHHPSCQRSDACEGKFCIVRKFAIDACSTPTLTECGIHPTLYACTKSTNQIFHSVCGAYAKNASSLMTTTMTQCGEPHLLTFHNEVGQRVALGSTIYLTPQTKIQIKCGGDIRSVIVVEEKIIDQTEPFWTRNLNCQDFVPFNVHKENRKKYSKTKLCARTTVDQYEIIKTYFYVVSLEKPVLTLSLPNGTECAPDSAIPHFSCIVQNYEAHQLEYLRVSLEVSHVVIGELNSTVGELSLHKIPVTAAGKYTCRAEVVYRTCSPFSEYKVEGVIEAHLHKSCLPLNVKSEYIKVIESDPTNKVILYALIGGVSLIAVVAICVITVSAYTRSLKSKKDRLRQPELEKTLNESDPANEGLILSGESLFKLSQLLMSPANNFKHAKDYVQRYLGSFDQEMSASSGKIVQIEGARYDDIPCYRHSQVRGMHINRMTDWKLRPLFIAMAPTPPDFAKFWELILIENIGTVVWIGDAKEGDLIRIDPYISLKQGVESVYKNRENLTVAVRTISVKDITESQYSAYAVDVVIKGSIELDAKLRRVKIIHVKEWPDHNIPQGASAARLYQTCATIETFHDSQTKEHQMPGLLFHCSAGVQRSAAMLSLYIGRQIFVDRKKINLIGVMKYVRAARFGAFLLPARGFMQVPIVLGGLAALQMSMQDEDLAAARPITVTKDEKAVFNALLNKKPTLLGKKLARYRTGASSKSTSAKLPMDGEFSGGGGTVKASSSDGGLVANSAEKSFDVFQVSAFNAGEASTDGRAAKKVFAPGKRKQSLGIPAAGTDAGSRAVFRSSHQPHV